MYGCAVSCAVCRPASKSVQVAGVRLSAAAAMDVEAHLMSVDVDALLLVAERHAIREQQGRIELQDRREKAVALSLSNECYVAPNAVSDGHDRYPLPEVVRKGTQAFQAGRAE